MIAVDMVANEQDRRRVDCVADGLVAEIRLQGRGTDRFLCHFNKKCISFSVIFFFFLRFLLVEALPPLPLSSLSPKMDSICVETSGGYLWL